MRSHACRQPHADSGVETLNHSASSQTDPRSERPCIKGLYHNRYTQHMGVFHILEHTADKGLEVEAGSLPELFETAARGLFYLMINPDAYPPTERVAITVLASDLGMLLVKWLNELVYQFEVHHRLFSGYSEVSIEELTDGRWRAQAQAHYRPIAPHELEWDGAPVKSVTYHGLRLERGSELWRLRFYVDV
ncbi:MAG: hypothetical protein KatS3mg020_0939 [Fimbriimonadales bacterium]|nr:MAG: hypothetical protein KatS3mg020_0939 [Fimbriimonadales bacterium]